MGKGRIKFIIIIACIMAILSVGTVTLTYAWLYDSAEIVNQTYKGTITNEIEENFNGTEKTNVKVQNTGNMNCFVRVAVVPIWRDENGNATTLKTDGTYTIEFDTEKWFEGQDGFWYCRKDIAPTEFTPVLIKKCTVNEELAKEYNKKIFDLQVLAQSIQSVPKNAVYEAWNIKIDN